MQRVRVSRAAWAWPNNRTEHRQRSTEGARVFLARLYMKNPDPILRLARDLRVVFRNEAAVQLMVTRGPDHASDIPTEWRTPAQSALHSGLTQNLTWHRGEQVFSCMFVPTDHGRYVDCYFADITALLQAEGALRKQNDYLAALHETTLGLMNHLDLAELLEAIVTRATELVHASFGWLYLYDAASHTMEVKVGTGLMKPHLGTRLERGEGLAGQVWQVGAPIAVLDYPSWSKRSHQFPSTMLESALGVPLASDKQIIGVLGVSQAGEAREFGQIEIDLLSRFAQLAVIALDNARLYTSAQQELRERQRIEMALRASEQEYRLLFDAAQRQAQELALLNKVRMAMTRALDLDALFRNVVEAIVETFGYTQVSLYLLEGSTLHMQYQVGYEHVIAHIPITAGIMGRVARTAKPVLLEDVRSDPAFLGAIEGIVSEVCVPLFDGGRVVGTLNVESTGGIRLSELDLRLMEALSIHVSIAIERARLYVETRHNEQRYRSVLENLQEVIFQTDVNGAWVFLNPAWMHMTGLSVEASLGTPMFDCIHPDDRARAAEQIAGLLRGEGERCQCEVRFLTAEGAVRWVEAKARTSVGADGAISGLSGVLNDTTERKRMEEELQAQRDFALNVMSAMGQGLTVTGKDGSFEYVNPAFARMLGYPPEQFVGAELEDFTIPDDLLQLAAHFERRKLGESTAYESRLRRADGSILPVLVTGTPRWREGQYVGSIAVVADLSQQKQMEEALAAARDHAVEASRLKSEFLATMSHEVRTPMSSIIGMNDLLLATLLDKEQREYALIVRESAEALLRILDDILDFSKIEAGKLDWNMEDFQPAVVLEKVVDLFAARAEAKQLLFRQIVSTDLPAWLRGDSGRLRQVLVNLVSNAFKFTKSGTIEMVTSVVSGTEHMVEMRFEVNDSGIGLSPLARQRLFQPFTQADGSMAREYEGTGLGLTISKKLVEMMGGEIGAFNRPQGGATFWFTARFELGSPPTFQTEAFVSEPATVFDGVRPVILLAEDNPVNQQLAVKQLERLGYEVCAVSDGPAAVSAYQNSPQDYALILMDCQMPGLDGFQTARQIREWERGQDRRVPIVAMTASAMQRDRETCLAAGMDDYISKPVRRAELGAIVARWSRSTRSPQQPVTASESAHPAAPSSPIPVVPHFIASLRRVLCDDDDRQLGEVIELFLATSAARLADLHNALDRQDTALVQRLAHSLKGSSGSLGALHLSALCGDLQKNAAQGDCAAAATTLEQVEAEFTRVRAVMETAR